MRTWGSGSGRESDECREGYRLVEYHRVSWGKEDKRPDNHFFMLRWPKNDDITDRDREFRDTLSRLPGPTTMYFNHIKHTVL